GAPIFIRVVRPSGRPVEDVRVIESTSDAGKSAHAGSWQGRMARAPAGVLSLHLPEEVPIQLRISNPEGGSGTSGRVAPPSAAAKNERIWTLPDGPAILGRVAGATSGRMIEGAEVEIDDLGALEPAAVSRVTHTDLTGSWRQEGFKEGDYRLIASADGYASAAKEVSV